VRTATQLRKAIRRVWLGAWLEVLFENWQILLIDTTIHCDDSTTAHARAHIGICQNSASRRLLSIVTLRNHRLFLSDAARRNWRHRGAVNDARLGATCRAQRTSSPAV
jgi:hypothetical protein